MGLSDSSALLYVLSSGVAGRLTQGRVERDPTGAVRVYDGRGDVIEYLSGQRLRSWCVVNLAGVRIGPWCSVAEEDRDRIHDS